MRRRRFLGSLSALVPLGFAGRHITDQAAIKQTVDRSASDALYIRDIQVTSSLGSGNDPPVTVTLEASYDGNCWHAYEANQWEIVGTAKVDESVDDRYMCYHPHRRPPNDTYLDKRLTEITTYWWDKLSTLD